MRVSLDEVLSETSLSGLIHIAKVAGGRHRILVDRVSPIVGRSTLRALESRKLIILYDVYRYVRLTPMGLLIISAYQWGLSDANSQTLEEGEQA